MDEDDRWPEKNSVPWPREHQAKCLSGRRRGRERLWRAASTDRRTCELVTVARGSSRWRGGGRPPLPYREGHCARAVLSPVPGCGSAHPATVGRTGRQGGCFPMREIPLGVSIRRAASAPPAIMPGGKRLEIRRTRQRPCSFVDITTSASNRREMADSGRVPPSSSPTLNAFAQEREGEHFLMFGPIASNLNVR
jgi:hypothetical protein